MTDIVIGSGPAGVAVAKARLDLGQKVILLDGGKVLEPEKAALRDAIAGGDDRQRPAYIAAQDGAAPGQVRRFGSDFAMEPADSIFADPGKVAVRASHAVGGLSNLWGTAVLPFAARDMADWPIRAEDLQPHLRAVQALMPVAGRPDSLETLFPGGLPDGPVEVPPTAQAEAILARIERAARKLAQAGLTAGMARQAVGAGCTRCGLCLNGCPWGLMWSSALALPDLQATGRLDHRPGALVRAVTTAEETVTCHLQDGQTVTGTRVFLAAGVLETARVLLTSGYADDLILREARHAFLPSLQIRPNRRRPDRGALTTLPQIFLELSDPATSPFMVHAQLYGWNEKYAPEMAQTYGRKLKGFGALWPVLARRLVVSQIFLHSVHWPGIGLRLAGDGRLNARVEAGGDADQVLPRAGQVMGRALKAGGLMPLAFALRPAAPGSSFHLGASLPMAKDPAAGQSDPLGRPGGAGRVHVVDASVLPAVPATTITYPMMANAHRIGAEAPV